MLQRQVETTVEGANSFAEWAGGDREAASRVRESEREADELKRALLETLREAFVTPLEPEDLFALSQGVDRTLNQMKDLVEESEAMSTPPDTGIATMAAALREAMGKLREAVVVLERDKDRATEAADEAIQAERGLKRAYYAGMGDLLEVEDRNERIARRELYRGCSRTGETVVEIAERIVYAVMKQT
jgi:uncharacterized protein Yka (UPF0111/DUF47 family)